MQCVKNVCDNLCLEKLRVDPQAMLLWDAEVKPEPGLCRKKQQGELNDSINKRMNALTNKEMMHAQEDTL